MLNDTARQDLRRSIKEAAAARQAKAVLSGVRALAVSGKPSDIMLCASAVAETANELVAEAGAKRLTTYIVRSVTVEPLLPFLIVEAALEGFVLAIEVGGYGSYMDDMLNPEGALGVSPPYDLVVVLLDLEDMAGQLPDLCADGLGRGVEEELDQCVGRVEQMLRSLRARSACRMVLSGCVVPDEAALGDVGESNLQGSLRAAVGGLNRQLAALCGKVPDCLFFDIDHVAARFGRADWRDRRLFLSSRLAVAPPAFSTFARSLTRTAAALFRAPRKILCTDLDNTLWGGVLGEDGPQGISTGSAFPGNAFLEYQRFLRRLRTRGILLAIVSKNNPADVEEAFLLRAADLGLSLSDFTVGKIGWNEKSDALRELAAELSLGLDSFVFVDDNPVECEAIRQQLPEVAVVQASADAPWTLVPQLEAAGLFDVVMVSEDDLKRAGEYHAQAQRQALSHGAGSRDEFLGSLDIVCTFLPATEAPLSRSVQLLGKTNQFNLTSRRHTAADVQRFAELPGGQALAVRVRDRFGDAGVVGLLLARTEGTVCRIDSLLLSCRVIGRGIETALLAMAAADAWEHGAQWLVGEYIESKKNAPCASFFADHGFLKEPAPAQDDHTASVFYKFDLTAARPAFPAWLTLEGKEEHEHAAGTAIAS